jgi:hypothetical protein
MQLKISVAKRTSGSRSLLHTTTFRTAKFNILGGREM